MPVLAACTNTNDDNMEPSGEQFVNKWDKYLPKHKQEVEDITQHDIQPILKELNGEKQNQTCGTDGWRASP